MILLKNNWKYIVMALMLIAIITMSKIGMNYKADQKRLEFNLVQLTMEHQTQVLNIKDKAQKRFLIEKNSLIFAIMDTLSLRPAKIKRIFNTKYVYVHDTVYVELTANEVDTTYKDFNHTFDPCASVKGKVNWSKNLLVFDEFKHDINTTTVYYWDRKHRFLWILSKKRHFAVTLNNCTGETTVKDIKFEK